MQLGTKNWVIIAGLIIVSNLGTIALTHYVLVKPKVIDLIDAIEKPKILDLQKVMDGSMTQEEFMKKQERVVKSLDTFVANEKGLILLRQCVIGSDGYIDVTKDFSNIKK